MECVFEVSESALARCPDYWRRVCDRYRRDGFLLALTYGASDPISLRTLLDIRPDYIKLERALVSDIETLACTRVIRQLADFGEHFSIPVVAEGVDRRVTAENLWLLNVATPVPDGPEFRLEYWPSHSTPPWHTSKASVRRGPQCWRRKASKL
jgi:EAL domain-containing protein (putative c-di-GMP-specific phosphodiesterase class I)